MQGKPPRIEQLESECYSVDIVELKDDQWQVLLTDTLANRISRINFSSGKKLMSWLHFEEEGIPSNVSTINIKKTEVEEGKDTLRSGRVIEID